MIFRLILEFLGYLIKILGRNKKYLPVNQFSSVTQSYLSLCDPMDYSTPGFPVHHKLPELAQTYIHRVNDATHPSHHLSSPPPPSIFPSIRVFSSESVLRIRWPKYWSFSFSISPSNEYSGLISFRIDWLDLLAVQGIVKSLFQHHSSKASIFWFSAFFMVHLSHPYIPGKTIALTRWTFVGKVVSLLFNMLSRLEIASYQLIHQYFPSITHLLGWTKSSLGYFHTIYRKAQMIFLANQLYSTFTIFAISIKPLVLLFTLS